MGNDSAYRIGRGLGSGLSAFLTESANKDLREEQELQRRNLRALLKAYIDPKTELGSGAMAELMQGHPGIKAQPGQPFGLPAEPEPESYDEMLERKRTEGYEKLSPEEKKHIEFKLPLPKEDKPPKPGVKERQTESYLDLLTAPSTVPASAEESTELERGQSEFGILEELLGIAPEKEKEPSATAKFANVTKAKSLVDSIMEKTGMKIENVPQYLKFIKHITDQLDAGVPLEDVELPKMGESGELVFPMAGEVEGEDESLAIQQEAARSISSQVIKNLRKDGISDSEILQAWQDLQKK